MRAYLGSAVLFGTLVVVFVLELATSAVGNDARLITLGALPGTGQLDGEYWRVVTFGFLHYDLIHILLNTVLLVACAPIAERRVGASWLLILFLTASIVSGIGILLKHSFILSQGASVGASGGLFGLLGAAIVLVLRFPAKSRAIPVALIVVLVLGLTYSVLPGISMVGHVSGLVVGAAVACFIPFAELAHSAPGAQRTRSSGP